MTRAVGRERSLEWVAGLRDWDCELTESLVDVSDVRDDVRCGALLVDDVSVVERRVGDLEGDARGSADTSGGVAVATTGTFIAGGARREGFG